MGVKPLSAPLHRAFTPWSPLNCKARIGQILEQAQSVLPKTYKAVKTTSQSGDEALRRNQLIWLAKNSLGKDVAVAKKSSPHERLWDASRPRAGSAKGHASWEGPTVWPHLWRVVAGQRCRRIANVGAGEDLLNPSSRPKEYLICKVD